jgi:NitT/TauT family transport system substrate-binding protein
VVKPLKRIRRCQTRRAAAASSWPTNACASALGLGGLVVSNFGTTASLADADPPPEITTVRIEKDPVICNAPQVVEELLRAEGLTDILYVDLTEEHVWKGDTANMGPVTIMIADGEVDFGRDFAATLILALEAKAPIIILTSLHLGGIEVVARKTYKKCLI